MYVDSVTALNGVYSDFSHNLTTRLILISFLSEILCDLVRKYHGSGGKPFPATPLAFCSIQTIVR